MIYTSPDNIKEKIKISNLLKEKGIHEIVKEIIDGLTSKKKYIPSKYFYDETGSKLFEGITQLPEYYPTRTEKSILKAIAPDLVQKHIHSDIIELGSGDYSKINILLNAISNEKLKNTTYIPVDISLSAIRSSSEKLNEIYPELNIEGIVIDFIHQLHLIPAYEKRFFCFLGSTIGNLTPDLTELFFQNLSNIMTKGEKFLLGVDLVKDEEILYDAYNDKEGLTARFNLNILSVINGIIQSNFPMEEFEHKAFYNSKKSRIEMHLLAKKDLTIVTPFYKEGIDIAKGESIHTENSYKFLFRKFNVFESISELSIKEIFTDSNKWFALILFEKN